MLYAIFETIIIRIRRKKESGGIGRPAKDNKLFDNEILKSKKLDLIYCVFLKKEPPTCDHVQILSTKNMALIICSLFGEKK